MSEVEKLIKMLKDKFREDYYTKESIDLNIDIWKEDLLAFMKENAVLVRRDCPLGNEHKYEEIEAVPMSVLEESP